MEPRIGGGVISPYNGDGVLNLPHEHGSYDARDAGASVLIDRERVAEYKTHAYGDVKDRPLFVAST